MQDLCDRARIFATIEESLDCSSLKYKYEYEYKHQVLQFELHAVTVTPKSNHYRWSRMTASHVAPPGEWSLGVSRDHRVTTSR